MFRRNSMKQLRYPAIPQSLTKSRDGLMLTAGQGSGQRLQVSLIKADNDAMFLNMSLIILVEHCWVPVWPTWSGAQFDFGFPHCAKACRNSPKKGNAECVMRQQMAMRIYDIGGKRVNEVKLTVFSDYAVRSHPSCRKKSRRKSGLSVPKESDIDMWCSERKLAMKDWNILHDIVYQNIGDEKIVLRTPRWRVRSRLYRSRFRK